VHLGREGLGAEWYARVAFVSIAVLGGANRGVAEARQPSVLVVKQPFELFVGVLPQVADIFAARTP
jgi:hypothetical protein